MKKIILGVLLICLSGASVGAEMMQKPGDFRDFSLATNPIAYPYFEAYAKRLYENFDVSRYWYLPNNSGAIAYVELYKRGLRWVLPDYKKKILKPHYVYATKVLEQTKTLPFPKGFDEKYVRVYVYLWKAQYNEIVMYYIPEKNGDKLSKMLYIVVVKSDTPPEVTPNATPTFRGIYIQEF